MKKKFKIISFDADDTLWVNEPYYRETEDEFFNFLSSYNEKENISKTLYKIEMQNLALYGYGAKGFMLSMIETALLISDNKLSQTTIDKIIKLGKALLNKPVILLDGVVEVLDSLTQQNHKLIVATKGDLLDQERKLEKSKIIKYFHHIEIMSDKKESDYQKLLLHLDIQPADFLMIGNSLKSDILPVISMGSYGIHIPYHITWQHEESDPVSSVGNFREVEHISDILNIIEV
jgi:putative hydrolase of the HAD superfamily